MEHPIGAPHRGGPNAFLLRSLVDENPLDDQLVHIDPGFLLLRVGDCRPERFKMSRAATFRVWRRIATASLTFFPRTRSATSRTFCAEPFMKRSFAVAFMVIPWPPAREPRPAR